MDPESAAQFDAGGAEAGAVRAPATDIPEPPAAVADRAAAGRPRELGGRDGPEPTRYGDWELRGRCIDF